MTRVDITRPDGSGILFSHEELACPATGEVRLHPGFDFHLAQLRMAFGTFMYPTSGCRSAAHNRAVGGVETSFHIWDEPPFGAEGALALDVERRGGVYARRLVAIALPLGWSIGVAKTFIHLDRRDLVGRPPMLWGYGNGGQRT